MIFHLDRRKIIQHLCGRRLSANHDDSSSISTGEKPSSTCAGGDSPLNLPPPDLKVVTHTGTAKHREKTHAATAEPFATDSPWSSCKIAENNNAGANSSQCNLQKLQIYVTAESDGVNEESCNHCYSNNDNAKRNTPLACTSTASSITICTTSWPRWSEVKPKPSEGERCDAVEADEPSDDDSDEEHSSHNAGGDSPYGADFTESYKRKCERTTVKLLMRLNSSALAASR